MVPCAPRDASPRPKRHRDQFIRFCNTPHLMLCVATRPKIHYGTPAIAGCCRQTQHGRKCAWRAREELQQNYAKTTVLTRQNQPRCIRRPFFWHSYFKRSCSDTFKACGMFKHDFVANLLPSPSVKKSLKIGKYLVKLWARVCYLVFWLTCTTKVREKNTVLTKGNVLSWEYRSPRKRNSRPSSTPAILNAHPPNTLFIANSTCGWCKPRGVRHLRP